MIGLQAEGKRASGTYPLERLLRLPAQIHVAPNLNEALRAVLNSALALTRMQRALFMVLDKKAKWEFCLGMDCNGHALNPADFHRMSEFLPEMLLQRETKFLGSALCLPLFSCHFSAGYEDNPLGIIYADSDQELR